MLHATGGQLAPPVEGTNFQREVRIWKTPECDENLQAFVCYWKTWQAFCTFFFSILGVSVKQFCGGLIKNCAIRDLVISSAQIWRASLACEMEMKTWHVLECLILLICFNSRSLHKHWLTAIYTERKIEMVVLDRVCLPERNLEQAPDGRRELKTGGDGRHFQLCAFMRIFFVQNIQENNTLLFISKYSV